MGSLPAPLFEWSSPYLNWFTFPIWMWMIAVLVTRVILAIFYGRTGSLSIMRRHARPWLWSLAGAVVWFVFGTVVHLMGQSFDQP